MTFEPRLSTPHQGGWTPTKPDRASNARVRRLIGLVGMLVSASCLAGLLLNASPASAAPAPAPHWLAITQAAPTDFHPGDPADFIEVFAMNDGDAEAAGLTTVTLTLPAGLTVNEASGFAEVQGFVETEFLPFGCEEASNAGTVTVTCAFAIRVPPGRTLSVNVNVKTAAGLVVGQSLVSHATVLTGGGPVATSVQSIPVTDAATPVPFGTSFVSDVTQAGGNEATQAGSHPFMFATLTAFNVGSVNANEKCNKNTTPSCAALNTQPRDIEVAVPAGVIGNATAIPYCTQRQFQIRGNKECPLSTQVGSLYLHFYGAGTADQFAPVYNIEPPPNQAAELGFTVGGAAHIPIFFHVRSDGDYGVTVDLSQINQFDSVRLAALSIWGTPSDPKLGGLRGSQLHCATEPPGACPPESLKPFLTMPSSCSGDPTLPLTFAGDSWQEPAVAPPFDLLASSRISNVSGCERLRFEPSLALSESSRRAGAQAGVSVDLRVPQNEESEALATPDVRDVEVALPEGMVISPSGSNGLVACTAAQFGEKVRAKGGCPAASKIAFVKITTPLLAEPVSGSLFVGEPECSPCSPAQAGAGQMVHLFLEASAAGQFIKLSGHTRINQATGQVTTVFKDNPQLPFSDLKVSLQSGPTAPLVNPSACGPAVMSANVTPWSSTVPSSITAPALEIEGCEPAGFAPGFEAGSSDTARAGAFTGLHVSLSRKDGEEPFGRVSVTTPPGLLGLVKSVEQCPEVQANAGTCSFASQIGTGSVVAGQGQDPLTVPGVKVFLTGPYEGQPFGLSIVTPARSGPFVLAGNTGTGSEVVRAAISIDPNTTVLTVATDLLPQALDGVPLDIRAINLDIDRPGFIFNPTNCDALSSSASFVSAGGAKSSMTSPFQAVDCARLPFKPSFTASTQGAASKNNGASLTVKVGEKPGEANIRKVDLSLPLQLPSRLGTLQLACTEAQFAANPAGCPQGSMVGAAKAITPLLAAPLEGPAILVSHGGASFPDLEFVLQGEGVTVILDGKTDIKHGVTYSRFETVPDAPITSFETRFPQGPHSILGAFLPQIGNYNLCTVTRPVNVTRHVNGHIRHVKQQVTGTLAMPTTITAQNGAVYTQTTHISITGCPQAVIARKASSRKGHRASRSR